MAHTSLYLFCRDRLCPCPCHGRCSIVIIGRTVSVCGELLCTDVKMHEDCREETDLLCSRHLDRHMGTRCMEPVNDRIMLKRRQM